MLKNPELIGEILSIMVAAVKIPVTVKIRAGWDSQSIVGPQVTQIAEAAGATAICIHGRTRAQAYRGPANWDYIKECKAVAKNILVIGNGDISNAHQAEKIFQHTGCDAILLARGTMGQPWIIQDIYAHLAGSIPQKRVPHDFRDALLEHLEYIVAYQPEHRAVTDLRRVGCWFLRKGRGVRELRETLNRSKLISEIKDLIHNYAWENSDFSHDVEGDAKNEVSSNDINDECC
jgi:nifR3 family TIM-barrel protein